MKTVVEWPHTSDELHAGASWDLVAAAVHKPCVSIGPTSGWRDLNSDFCRPSAFLHVVCYSITSVLLAARHDV